MSYYIDVNIRIFTTLFHNYTYISFAANKLASLSLKSNFIYF